MKSTDQLFNEWFDKKYPEGTMGQPVMREAFKEVAYNGWQEALCATGIRFVGKRTLDGKSIEFFFPDK